MTNKECLFLQTMLEESTITKAAAKAGISRKTAYKYLHDPEFVRELNKRRLECLSDSVRFLQCKLALCGETLVNIVENPHVPEQIKINAINSIFANCRAMSEVVDVITRLECIELKLEEHQQ